jgi:hypothetical protein
MLRFQSLPSSLSQKVTINEPPPGSPTGALMERVARFQNLFNISLAFLTKLLMIKRNFTLLSKAVGEEHPPMFPKRCPYGNSRPFPEPYLAYPSGSPVKEPSLQVPLIELPHTEMLHFQSPPSFIFQRPW